MHRRLKRMLLWLAVLGLMAVIYAFSAQAGTESDGMTAVAVMPLAELLGSLQDGDAAANAEQLYIILGTIVRKIAHVCEYALLGLLVSQLLQTYGIARPLLAIGLCIAYAVTDELHQACVPGRAGRVTDVLIDGLGVTLGVYARRILEYLKRKSGLKIR